MEIIISLTIGLLFASLVFIFSQEDPSLVKQRMKSRTKQAESNRMSLARKLHDKIRPFSQKNVRTANYIAKTKKLLLQAGYAATEEDVIKFDTQRVTSTIFAAFGGLAYAILMFSTLGLIGAILFIFIVYKWPELKLNREIKARQKEFMRYLPDAVDLLSICVQAGLSLDASFSKVAEEFKLTSKVVSVEFERLNKDILSGLNRQESYKNLVLRNENQDLQSFVALLIQTDKLGTSISQSLNAFCDSLRTKKRQRIEELSQQASTKMTIPMVLFLLPSIFIIIMYPAIQKITQNLGKM